jgi:hypothetical protein
MGTANREYKNSVFKDLFHDEKRALELYNLDFSMQTNAAGLTLGTWPVSITHVSGGSSSIRSESWMRGIKLYRNKWIGGRSD